MIRLYIDPGTGSMLFTVLIGILSAAVYLARAVIIKIKSTIGAGKKIEADKEKIPVVLFSDNKRYWTTFRPICEELDKRGQQAVYMTQSPDDPALDAKFKNIRTEFIGEGNQGFARLNMLNARVVVSTTPSLDVFQWKRSRDAEWYVHVLHNAGDITLYRIYGIDYYDAILLSGKFQEKEVRTLESLRDLPSKELVLAGIPYMDEMAKRVKDLPEKENGKPTVLLAPSWGKYSLLSLFGERLIDKLIDTGYDIVIRPHPQSFTADKEVIDRLMAKYPDGEKVSWNRDTDNYDVLAKSDIMISDFSGVTFDFAFIFDRPVIFSNVGFSKAPYDAWQIDDELWNISTLRKIGTELTEENIDDIKNIIDTSLANKGLEDARKEARDETWCNIGSGASEIADYIVGKVDELGKKNVPADEKAPSEAKLAEVAE